MIIKIKSMNSKIKFLAAFVMLSGALLLMGAGCAKQPTVSPATTGAGAPVAAPAGEEANKPAEQAASVGKMTDDIYVEITAEMNYSLGKGEFKYAGDEGFTDLLKEHGVTKAEFDAFNTALTADPARAASLGVKIMQRLKEISK